MEEYDNSSVGEEEHLEWRHVREAVLDWQVWILAIINMINSIAGVSHLVDCCSA